MKVKIMSEYQYYEFYSLNKPLSKACQAEMQAISSSAKFGTHNVQYTYNSGNFSGDDEALLAEHFDVMFYMSKFGDFQLMFRYDPEDLNIEELEDFWMDDIVEFSMAGSSILVNIELNDDNRKYNWLVGEKVLADLLPLYDELKAGEFQLLQLVHLITAIYAGLDDGHISTLVDELLKPLTRAQKALLKHLDISLSDY